MVYCFVLIAKKGVYMKVRLFLCTMLAMIFTIYGNADNQSKIKEIQKKINSLNKQSQLLKLETNKAKLNSCFYRRVDK